MCTILGSTIREKSVQENIKKIIQAGGLIVFPTETVYGIGADATNPEAVKRIFEAKGRPQDNPLIVHIAEKKDIYTYAHDVSERAERLMDQFWPGPLTLVVKKKEIIPSIVSGGLDTVGIRMPSLDVARDIIRAAGVPLCAPSANISGRPSSTIFDHVKEDFMGKVDLMFDGGFVEIGLESTVIDMTQPIPVLLRPGAVTKKMIEDVLEMSILDATEEDVKDVPKSPGMKYTHYAPKGMVYLLEGEKERVCSFINEQIVSNQTIKIGVIAPHEYLVELNANYQVDLGSLEHFENIGRHIFLALRQMDELQIEVIYIPALSNQGLGQAIMNRLIKAAGHRIIRL